MILDILEWFVQGFFTLIVGTMIIGGFVQLCVAFKNDKETRELTLGISILVVFCILVGFGVEYIWGLIK